MASDDLTALVAWLNDKARTALPSVAGKLRQARDAIDRLRAEVASTHKDSLSAFEHAGESARALTAATERAEKAERGMDTLLSELRAVAGQRDAAEAKLADVLRRVRGITATKGDSLKHPVREWSCCSKHAHEAVPEAFTPEGGSDAG